MQVGELHAKVTVDVSGVGKSLNVAKRQINEANSSIKSSFANLSAGIKAGVAGIAVLLSTKLISGLANTAREMERLNRSLKFAAGDATKATDSFKFLQDQAIRLGLPLNVLAQSFIGISAVTKGTALEGEQTKKIFLGIAETAAVLGLSSEQISGSFTAIQQSLAKGKITAEEWRGQLAERIPIATRVLTKALGITTQELEVFMQKGLLQSIDVIPIFVDALSKEVAPALDSLAGSTTQAVGRMEAAWFNLKKTFVESPISSAIVFSINLITAALEHLTSAIAKTVSGFKLISSNFKNFFAGNDKLNNDKLKLYPITYPVKLKIEPVDGTTLATKKGIDLGNTLRASIAAIKVKPIEEDIDKGKDLKDLDDSFSKVIISASRPSVELNIIMDSLTDSIGNVTDALTEFIATGRIDFREMINSVLGDLTRLIIKLYVLKPLIEAISGVFGFGGKGFAGALLGGGGFGFANGGVINEPIAGIGLSSGKSYSFGEMGPETVTPGVGNTPTNIIINAVDAASFNDMVKRNSNSILQVVTRSLKNGNAGMVSAVRGSL